MVASGLQHNYHSVAHRCIYSWSLRFTFHVLGSPCMTLRERVVSSLHSVAPRTRTVSFLHPVAPHGCIKFIQVPQSALNASRYHGVEHPCATEWSKETVLVLGASCKMSHVRALSWKVNCKDCKPSFFNKFCSWSPQFPVLFIYIAHLAWRSENKSVLDTAGIIFSKNFYCSRYIAVKVFRAFCTVQHCMRRQFGVRYWFVQIQLSWYYYKKKKKLQ